MCTYKHPFTGANQAGLILRIVRGKYEPIPSFYSKDLAEIVGKCLQRDTRKRPSIQDLLDMDSIKKKARSLNIKIPTKEEVMSNIENQKNEMLNTFHQHKIESEDAPKSENSSSAKAKSKPEPRSKPKTPYSKGKESNLGNYVEPNNKASKSKLPADNKPDLKPKVVKSESQSQDGKKNEEYLEK